jgi:hypothetical protein
VLSVADTNDARELWTGVSLGHSPAAIVLPDAGEHRFVFHRHGKRLIAAGAGE